MNINLTDDAWDLLDSVGRDQGFEVWRMVNQDLAQKTRSDILNLEDAVLTPRRSQTLPGSPRLS